MKELIKGEVNGFSSLKTTILVLPQDVEFILGEIKKYLNADITVRRGDVTSCWSGIRPLVTDPKKTDTQSLARNHIIHVR